MEFANKTQFNFEPGGSEIKTLDTTGVKYNTPDPVKEKLGDLARLSYVNGVFKVSVKLEGASSAGAATARLKAAGTEVATIPIDLTAGTTITGAVDVELSAVVGASLLEVEFQVDTAADAATKGTITGVLEVSHPVVIAV